jgi:hypothetical protein
MRSFQIGRDLPQFFLFVGGKVSLDVLRVTTDQEDASCPFSGTNACGFDLFSLAREFLNLFRRRYGSHKSVPNGS